jgi:hypothetical protein
MQRFSTQYCQTEFNISKRSYTMTKLVSFQECKEISKSINELEYIKRSEDKRCMIISIYAEKAFGRIQYPSMIKALKELGIEGMLYNIKKAI